jgi:hypothetical protein
VASDVRSYYAHRLLTASTRRIMELTYPRLLALHDLDDTIALPDPNSGVIDMPACMRSSHLFMEAGGVYVIGGLLCSCDCSVNTLGCCRKRRNDHFLGRPWRLAANITRLVRS